MKELKDMTVADILAMPEFDTELKKVMSDVKYFFFDQRGSNRVTREINELTERGIWNPEELKEKYSQILEKRELCLSSWQRNFVKDICFSAYGNVINILKAKEDEEAKV